MHLTTHNALLAAHLITHNALLCGLALVRLQATAEQQILSGDSDLCLSLDQRRYLPERHARVANGV